MDIHKRYDALLEKIISDREELRRKSKVDGCEDGDDEKVKDFLDILLDVAEQKECEVQLTRNHVKSLILVSDSCFIYIFFKIDIFLIISFKGGLVSNRVLINNGYYYLSYTSSKKNLYISNILTDYMIDNSETN